MMFERLWSNINPYFFLIVGIPCMSIFPFRFQKKYKLPFLILGIILTCFLWQITRFILVYNFHSAPWWPNFLLDQVVYIFFLTLACFILYKGNHYSMMLTIFLSMSMAAQIGCIAGGIINFFHDSYTIFLLMLRDILGYGVFALFYLILWKYLHVNSFYLTKKSHLILLGISLGNFLLNCAFTTTFPIGDPASVPFYTACLFTTCSITFLLFLFTKDHEIVQEQQLILQENKLSENTYAQIQEAAAQMREVKHELSNYFVYANQLIQKHDYDTLEQYLAKIIDSNLPVTDSISTGNLVVDSIINQKNAYAKSLHIRTDFRVHLSPDLPFDDLTLCTVFGNLLNNAIEACRNQDSPFILLDVHPVKSYLAIRIDNSVNHDVLKDNPQLQTTKKDALNHGNGMRILHKIVQKYDGMLHYEMSGPNCFSMQLMLKF